MWCRSQYIRLIQSWTQSLDSSNFYPLLYRKLVKWVTFVCLRLFLTSYHGKSQLLYKPPLVKPVRSTSEHAWKEQIEKQNLKHLPIPLMIQKPSERQRKDVSQNCHKQRNSQLLTSTGARMKCPSTHSRPLWLINHLLRFASSVIGEKMTSTYSPLIFSEAFHGDFHPMVDRQTNPQKNHLQGLESSPKNQLWYVSSSLKLTYFL